jgi:hypothetical protein
MRRRQDQKDRNLMEVITLKGDPKTGRLKCPRAEEKFHIGLNDEYFILRYNKDKTEIIAECLGCGMKLRMKTFRSKENAIPSM